MLDLIARKKIGIRQMAMEIGLPFWNKPPNHCLATRMGYGEMITKEKLDMMDESENFLKDMGFSIPKLVIAYPRD